MSPQHPPLRRYCCAYSPAFRPNGTLIPHTGTLLGERQTINVEAIHADGAVCTAERETGRMVVSCEVVA